MSASQNDGRGTVGFLGPIAPAFDYAVDALQRSALFWDVMRQRGNQYRAHLAEVAPHVLSYGVELVVDGRTLDRPVNHALVRIVPPKAVEIDPTRRPFVVIDPRAGHGPGIGGFKADSEIGVALNAGHPCYFVGFLPDPVPGQTLGDIALAEAVFLQKVIDLHPQADGKPCVVGNCQAGWAVMMLAAMRPDLLGPMIIAGSPLSYWAGVRGQNPMRYTGGLLGGSWLTAFTSDLGNGKFDGAWLVQNFENLNPANTLWTKQYNLYSRIDTEAPRYLGFERWWGGHINLNAEEIQFIVDELFIGNKLAAGRIQASDGVTLDIRNIRSPIVIFCSKGDNITPPPQALDWILDLYENVDEIRSYGQTIVYTVHENIGHLGIFVSSGVARKEHGELSSNIDLIDTLPPGLYEAVFEEKTADSANPDLISGNWAMRCEERTLEDIRRLGCNTAAEDRSFAAVARISETNLSLYRVFVEPLVRAMTSAPAAHWMQQLHPLRLQYEMCSNANPLMANMERVADWVLRHRRPVAKDNPFLSLQEAASSQIIALLDFYKDVRDGLAEQLFFSIYGSPLVQAIAGVGPAEARPPWKAGKSRLHQELLQARIADIKSRIPAGGLREAVVRSLLYVGMARGAVDERAFEMVRRIRLGLKEISPLSLSAFKTLVREQYLMLLVDTEGAIAALPAMLPPDLEMRHKALDILKQILTARGEIYGEVAERLRRIDQLFAASSASPSKAVQRNVEVRKAS
jgi:pimeloyl-ACP methyl ester carboxylesterase